MIRRILKTNIHLMAALTGTDWRLKLFTVFVSHQALSKHFSPFLTTCILEITICTINTHILLEKSQTDLPGSFTSALQRLHVLYSYHLPVNLPILLSNPTLQRQRIEEWKRCC